MVKLGRKLTEKDNQIAALQHTNAGLVSDVQTCRDTPCPAPPPQSGSGMIVFLIGLACGMGAAFGVLYMVTR
jgi:hypothetical protein